jgi:hypothetical protein
MSIKVEKGIAPEPDPPAAEAKLKAAEKRKMKYPWMSLEIGDSFETDISSLNAAQTNARYAGERYGRTFEARWHKGKIRIWRWA